MSLQHKTLVSLFAALLCVSSYIVIPIGPVPVTLQVLFVLLAGSILGARLGALSVIVWIILGVFGLPVFASGKAGPITLLGPTGGYLLGFILCAWIVGKLSGVCQGSKLRMGAAMLLGVTVMYIAGLAGFMASFAFFLQKPMTLGQALSMAVWPFLPFELVKVGIGAWISPALIAAIRRAGVASEPQKQS